VLDYLWGQPAESALQAISQKGLRKAGSRVRFIQIGSSAGPSISLNAATLRSSGLELIGSGFGSASLDQIKIAVGEFFPCCRSRALSVQRKDCPTQRSRSALEQPGTRHTASFSAVISRSARTSHPLVPRPSSLFPIPFSLFPIPWPLVDHPRLHYELHILQHAHIVQGIFLDGDNVRHLPASKLPVFALQPIRSAALTVAV